MELFLFFYISCSKFKFLRIDIFDIINIKFQNAKKNEVPPILLF